jgi:hypothetical protein
MKHGSLPPRRLGRLLAITVFIMCGIAPSLNAKAAPAGDPSATVFYTTTTSAYDTWSADTSDSPPPPARTANFPAGTHTVAFYFDYDGATADNTQYAVVVKNAAGAIFVTSDTQTVDYESGTLMVEVDAPNSTFPAGAYTASLSMDEAGVASTTFSVSSSSASKAKPAATTFYATSKSWYDWWVAAAKKSRPAKWARFPSGTSRVAFYFEGTNIVPKVTKFQIVVYDESGDVYAHDAQFTRSGKTTNTMLFLTPDSDAAYQDGTYTAVIWIDGHTTLRTTFNVMAAG